MTHSENQPVNEETNKIPKSRKRQGVGMSDDVVDGIALVAIIVITVTALSYFLYTL